jgi:hypothetical protein
VLLVSVVAIWSTGLTEQEDRGGRSDSVQFSCSLAKMKQQKADPEITTTKLIDAIDMELNLQFVLNPMLICRKNCAHTIFVKPTVLWNLVSDVVVCS